MSWRSIRTLIPVGLLVMVTMRLVWMQLRDYTPTSNYRALVTQNNLINDRSEDCGLAADRGDSLQLREFVEAGGGESGPNYSWFRSWGYQVFLGFGCQDGEFRPANIVRANQYLLVAIVGLACVLLRMLTRSWIFAMVGAVVLLSRGHLVGQISDTGPWGLQSLFVMAWAVSLVHFFLSGSPVTLLASFLMVVLGTLIDPVFWILGAALPILLLAGVGLRHYLAMPVIQRFRAEQRKLRQLIRRGKLKVYDGSVLSSLALDIVDGLVRTDAQDQAQKGRVRRTSWLFYTLREPFAIWVMQNRRWLKLVTGLGLATSSLFLASLVFQYLDFAYAVEPLFQSITTYELILVWLKAFYDNIAGLLDWHLGLSLMLVFASGLQGPGIGLKGFFEICWAVIAAIGLMMMAVVVYDYFDFQVIRQIESGFGVWSMMAWARSPQAFIWFEPLLLAVGQAALYNLLVIVNQRWSRQRLQG